MTDTLRKCRTCGNIKPLSDYTVNRKMKDGLSTECRDCGRARNNKAYAADPEKHRKRVQKYRESDPEKAREILRASRARNRDFQNAVRREERRLVTAGLPKEEVSRRKEEFKKQYEANPLFQAQAVFSSRKAKHDTIEDRRKEARKVWEQAHKKELVAYRADFYDKNKEKARQVNSAWRLANPGKIANNRHKRRTALGASNFTNDHLWWLHQWQDGCCYYCGKPGGDEHLEHLICLSKNGENENHNAVYACGACNSSKLNRLYMIEWDSRFERHPVRFFHAKFLKELAQEFGLTAQEGHIELNGIKVFMLSTFAFSLPHGFTLPQFAAVKGECIFVWDFEWKYKKEQVLNVVKAKLGLQKSDGARKYTADLISSSEAFDFFEKYHLQGARNASIYIGLRDREGAVCAAASFILSNSGVELARLAFKNHIAGGFSKLLSFFRKKFDIRDPIFSYCDTRFGEGKGYRKVGFVEAGETKESYSYVSGMGIVHRLQLSPSAMQEKWPHYSSEHSEEQNANAHGFRKLIGLPQKRYVLD